ncbi:GSCOCG00012182001-RA-CDS [Cotesia congregata]|uniref:Derlin n=1 Tax=Cotesia congregata TaxID=51543 RepID=A0A8J2MSX7_COTCN|nr:GSCOCG00012182001-RA-CDS [Cotesia congregata]CAG5108219.1 Similar to DERL1: Derlin-1 (Homo sapiens) [Cotesia congregata]
MSDFRNWVNSLPIFTRYWLMLTIGLSLIGRFGLVSSQLLTLRYDNLIHNFEIWRVVTSLFYYPLRQGTGFHFMINCFFLYRYSLKLEQEEFIGRPADYFFMLIFNWMCCVVIGLIVNLPLLMDPMVISVLYVWCQLNQNVIVNFWFGSRFKAMYLPWVLCGFNLILSGNGILELIGILVGNLYFFLKFKYPQEYDGPELLNTPKILEKYFPVQRVNIGGFSDNNVNNRAQLQLNRHIFGGHNWGRGHVLGQ